MTKAIQLIAILFAFVMQSTNVLASTHVVTPVYIYYKSIQKPNGSHNPSKAPGIYDIPLSIFLDEENRQLVLSDSQEEVYTYCIYNESEEVMSQGVLNFISTNSQYIDIGILQNGTYNIIITKDNCAFIGMFNIN